MLSETESFFMTQRIMKSRNYDTLYQNCPNLKIPVIPKYILYHKVFTIMYFTSTPRHSHSHTCSKIENVILTHPAGMS